MRLASYLGVGILDVFYPRSCLVTGKPLDDGAFRFLSEEGASRFFFIDGHAACSKCGVPGFGVSSPDFLCRKCLDREEELQLGRSRSIVLLDENSRPLVYSLKYRKQSSAARDMAVLAARVAGIVEFLSDAVLVPVPLHKKRLRWRGYNQSEHLADAFLKIAPGARVENALIRVRDTGTQTRLDAAAREKNVRDAFSIKSGIFLNPLERYVLVDDVFTTGATLSECAKALRKAGALNIDAVTFAHG